MRRRSLPAAVVLVVLAVGCAAPRPDTIEFGARGFAYRLGQWDERLKALCKAKKLEADVCRAGRADIADALKELAKPPGQRSIIDLDKALDIGLNIVDKLL